MKTELFDALTDELAEQTLAKLGPKLLAFLDEKRTAPAEDPLLTAAQAGARLGLSDTKVRELVEMGHLRRAPGLLEIRIRQSVVDSYGKENPKAKRA